MILLFFSALAVGFSGAMMPGSLLTYTIRQALSSGPRSGFIITAGHAFLELLLIIFIFLGFHSVLQSAAAQIAIGIVGGLFLVYMGGGMVYESLKNRLTLEADNKQISSQSMFISGIIISATNPYFLLWWAVIGLGFIMQSYNSFSLTGVIIYFIGHISADFIWYGLVSIIVGKTRSFITERPYRFVIAVLGCLLIYFGANFIYGAMAII